MFKFKNITDNTKEKSVNGTISVHIDDTVDYENLQPVKNGTVIGKCIIDDQSMLMTVSFVKGTVRDNTAIDVITQKYCQQVVLLDKHSDGKPCVGIVCMLHDKASNAKLVDNVVTSVLFDLQSEILISGHNNIEDFIKLETQYLLNSLISSYNPVTGDAKLGRLHE